MKFPLLFLAVILSATTALPVENVASQDVSPRFLEDVILGIIEGLRETMLTGSDTIPVLDPLEIEHLYLELDDLGLPGSHATIEDVEVNYLSTFVIDDLIFSTTNIILQRYMLEVEGHIPVIDVNCNKYDLNVNAMGLSVYGAGSAKLKLIDPRITAKIEVGLGILGGISVTIRSADVVFFLRGFEPEITGLFNSNNSATDDFINTFLRYLVPDLVELFQAEISEVINSIIEGIGSISIDLRREEIEGVLKAIQSPENIPVNA